MVWRGSSGGTSSAAVALMVVGVSLVEVGRGRLMVARADGDSRVPSEGDEEEACSEFWSSF